MTEELKIDNDQATKEMLENNEYKYGFVTDIEQEVIPKGISEEVINFISKKKNEPSWLLDFRLKAYSKWKKMKEPSWAKLNVEPIKYDDISYFAAPKEMPKSLDDIDPEILDTYNKLGIPLEEQKQLEGVAVDVVFDSVSLVTTFKEKLIGGTTFKPTTKVLDKYTVETKDACFKSFSEIDHKNFITIKSDTGKAANNKHFARSYNFGIFLEKALKNYKSFHKFERLELQQLKEFYYEYFIERIGDATIKAYGTSIKATASDVSKNGVAYRVYGCGMHAPAQKSSSSDIKSIVALESVVVLPK